MIKERNNFDIRDDNFAAVIRGEKIIRHRKAEHVPPASQRYPIPRRGIALSRVRNFINAEYTEGKTGISDNELNRASTIDTHACFRDFPTILHVRWFYSVARRRWKPPSAEVARAPDRIDVKAIEITNGPAPLVPSVLCNTGAAVYSFPLLRLC